MSWIRSDSFTGDYTACAAGRSDSTTSDCALRNHYIIPPISCHFSPNKNTAVQSLIDILFRFCYPLCRLKKTLLCFRKIGVEKMFCLFCHVIAGK